MDGDFAIAVDDEVLLGIFEGALAKAYGSLLHAAVACETVGHDSEPALEHALADVRERQDRWRTVFQGPGYPGVWVGG